jgi:hypothetical protein
MFVVVIITGVGPESLQNVPPGQSRDECGTPMCPVAEQLAYSLPGTEMGQNMMPKAGQPLTGLAFFLDVGEHLAI